MSLVITEIRVLSFNIHKGFSAGNLSFTLRQIRDAVRSVDADLVFLQEVLGEHVTHSQNIKDWPTVSQFEYLADTIWHHHAYGKNAVYEDGHHGNAILSKYPIVEWWNENISAHRYENRGLLHIVTEVPGWKAPLHAICLHLGLTNGARQVQLKKICSRVKGTVPDGCGLLIAGDFNDWNLSASSLLEKEIGVHEVCVKATGRHVKTFPSALPLLSLDRIYAKGFDVKEARVLTSQRWRRLSDHAPVYGVLSIV